MRHNLFLPELLNGMDRFLDFETRPTLTQNNSWGRLASCDIEENETEYKMHFDVPGVKKEDVQIEINGQDLKVSGERKFIRNEDNLKGFHLRERSWGHFERRFHLSDDADLEKVEASFKDGVLTILVAKKESLKPRSIEIK